NSYDYFAAISVRSLGECLLHVDDPEPDGVAGAAVEHARFEEQIGRRVVLADAAVHLDTPNEVVAANVLPQSTPGVHVERHEVADGHDLVRPAAFMFAFPGVVDDVAPRLAGIVSMNRDVGLIALFARPQGAHIPQHSGTMDVEVARCGGFNVDTLDNGVGVVLRFQGDGPGGRQVRGELGETGVEAVRDMRRGQPVAEALVDGAHACPEDRARLAPVTHGLEALGHYFAEESFAALFG